MPISNDHQNLPKPVGSLVELVSSEQSFVGFGEDHSVTKSSAKLEVLKIIQRQLGNTRKNIGAFRDDKLLLRQIWRRRYMCSESRFESVDSVETEVSDIITELPKIGSFTSTPRVTRSCGTVKDYPNVQQGT